MMKRKPSPNQNWSKTRKERQEEAGMPRREMVVESLKLPKDSILGASIVTLT